jgi:hypothetical protein
MDQVNMFGGSGSGPIFISVNSLMGWVSREKREVDDLEYVDDSFGIEEDCNRSVYAPYHVKYPTQQVCLLELWDKIRIPHKPKKQIYGTQLLILGIEVDVINLTFTLPEEAIEQFLKELAEWCQSGVRRKAKEWQRLAGWVNWALNIYPLLCPALNNIYDKLKGKGQEARIWANNSIRGDLQWARDKVLESGWGVDTATCLAKTDACPRGFAFWYPQLNIGFATSTPSQTPATQIAFYKSLAVLSTLEDARSRFSPESRVVVYTDNFATVTMFNSL